MAKSERQKLRLLYLRDYLRQNTDENHPATTQQITEYLAKLGIRVERKTVYDDVDALRQYGMEIHSGRGRNAGYYVAQREFELPELKLLVDAVQSCRFLSARRSMALIRKLAALSTQHEAELLRRQVVVSGRPKTDNEEIYANVDVIHEAIGADRQITFRYFDWDVDRTRRFREGEYQASPLALCWDDDRYYLIAHGPRHGLTHYRVDKMAGIRLTATPRVITREMQEFDPGAYSKEVFGMFRGRRQRVRLRFENSLAGVVLDRFGADALLIPSGPDDFKFTAEISISPNFLGWIAGFGGRAKILGPKRVVEEYRAFCQQALEALPPTK